VAASGEEALDLCRREHFDAAFVDFLMTGLSGHELGRALAKAQPELPLVFMSGRRIDAAEHSHVADFLKKPFDLHEIQLKLREVLDRAFGD
jgi:CheY-like chemotaxis protein